MFGSVASTRKALFGMVPRLQGNLVRFMGQKPTPPKPSRAPVPAREPLTYEKAAKEDTATTGWREFKILTKKSRYHQKHGSKRFTLNWSKKANPWLYKYSAYNPREARERSKGWVDKEELTHIRRTQGYKRPPLEEREKDMSNKHLMSTLRKEEIVKIENEWPRHVEPFRSGDKIQITKYLTLDRDNKFEIIKGTCIGRSSKTLESYFRIINYKIDAMYEMNIPLWSPFIQKIEVLEKGKGYRQSKLYYLKDREYKEYIVK